MSTLILKTVLALGAGVLLNLTPCVLPAIPLKVRAILGETGSTRKGRCGAALAFLAGTLLFFLALGGATALLQMTWGGLFRSRAFLGVLSAVLFLAGIGEFVDLSLPLPQALHRVRGKKYMEPFLAGALVGILSTPCTGLFLGGVLAFALTQPPAVTLWLFSAVGFGLALPCILVVVRPDWLGRLPRGGPWTARVQEFLGFVLLAGAVFFARVLLPEAAGRALWLLWAAGLGGWALLQWTRPGSRTGKVVTTLAAAAGVAFVLSAQAGSRESSLPWEPYGKETIASALARGAPVLVEFTADWCINCKVLEKTVYEAEEVVRAAREAGLAALRVDLTGPDPEGESLLVSFGGAGLPFAVVLSPGGEVVARLPDLFTPGTLASAIRRAGRSSEPGVVHAAGAAEPASNKGKEQESMKTPGRSIPEGKNRLALETSPYLQKHAGNPVDWYPWGDGAFAKARAENKPVFLSIGYSTCYWCSVMERESFEDPAVGEAMNRYVVSIKVDREERPDVDGIYMTGLLLMAGSGGWPMSMFLTPDRKPFFGATYVPKPQFLALLEGVHAAWRDRRAEVLEQADRVARAIAQAGAAPEERSASLPGPEHSARAAARYGEIFDREHGGFGGAPKFPQPPILEFLMSRFETAGDREALSMAERTLDAITNGGIHDQAGGGFHRYSTDGRWLVPHFEKMLYDQAQLLRAYARAGKITGKPAYRRTGAEIVAYLKREMQSEAGLFFSAEDAEVDGEEGKSYVWTSEELEAVLDGKEFGAAGRILGFAGPPSFEGRHILHRPAPFEAAAKAEGIPLPELLRKVDGYREKVLAARGKRRQPLLDDKSIASWNGLMIEALAYAGRAWKEREPVRMAERAAEDLLRTLRDKEGRLLHVSRGGQAKIPAFLDDYAAVVLGFLELSRATGNDRWRTEAERIGAEMVDLLWEEPGGFRYTVPSVTGLIASPRDSYDGVFPAGNSLAVRALVGLAANGYPRYAPYAAATLKAFEGRIRESPAALPYMLWGAEEFRLAKLPEEGTPALAGLPTSAGLVTLEGRLSPETLSPGTPAELSVSLTVAEGWHVNANPASLPSLVPTTLSAEIPGGEATVTPRYPGGKVIAVGPTREKLSVYEGRVALSARIVPVRLAAAGREGRLSVSVRVQACNDTGRCLAPATVRVEVPVSFAPES